MVFIRSVVPFVLEHALWGVLRDGGMLGTDNAHRDKPDLSNFSGNYSPP